MGWDYWFATSQGGVRKKRVFPLNGGRFTNRLGADFGSGEHSFLLRSADNPYSRSVWQDMTTPWSRMLVASFNDEPQYAGIITGHEWDGEKGVLTVKHSELRTIVDRRYPFMVPYFTTDPAYGYTTITGKSLRGMVRRIHELGYISTSGDGWHFPVDLPSDEGGGVSRTWYWYEFPKIAAMLEEFENTEGGPDSYLMVKLVDGTFRWDLQIGSPRLSNGTIRIPRAADVLTGFSQDTDASGQMSGTFALGKGSEQDMRVGKAGSADVPGARAPVMDVSISMKDVDDPSMLFNQAKSKLGSVKDPLVTQSFGVRGILPKVGSTLRYWHPGDEFLSGRVWRDAYVVGRTVTVGSDKVGLVVE